MTLALEFLQQIINVQWSGATVFVYGTYNGNELYYVRFKNNNDDKPEQRTIMLPAEPLYIPPDIVADTFSISGSSYVNLTEGTENKKDRVFLFTGQRRKFADTVDNLGNPITVIRTTAVIYKSADGLAWQIVREQETRHEIEELGIAVAPMALVWNKDSRLFYYDQFFLEVLEDGGVTQDQIFSSANGADWNVVSENTVDSNNSDYISPFVSYCIHNDCKDSRDQNVPDGVIARDKKTTVRPVVAPTYSYNSGGIDYLNGTSEVESSKEDGTEEGGIFIPDVANVTCIAGCNGILLAGGSAGAGNEFFDEPGVVAFSLDDGRTWKLLAHTSAGAAVTSMVAAPATDTRSAEN